ncbi:cell division protein ZipA [Thiomicrorhabdus chilensis]|uniref:cell division protein ZipA C-terminal FtsZ-binding domain-containing protein n=1 Tax=Thiomicrorhabdus chilensis TaxID=63656 RepID=UPI0003F5A9AA|nr:cell division protein ZipA C-terminal FtsZ-binding domain-containing protein [Thiomicrorhabdus chilensis]
MNELQQVLLVFAVIVIAVLYFLSKKRQTKPKDQTSQTNPVSTSTQPDSTNQDSHSKLEASLALNSLGESHAALSEQTEARLNIQEPDVPENQTSLPFGDEFTTEAAYEQSQPLTDQADSNPADEELHSSDQKGPKHHVLEVEELYTLDEVGAGAATEPKVNFGIPEEKEGVSPGVSKGEKTEPQIFALLVLSTGGSGQEFSMDTVHQALLGVGLSLSANQIYVTTDSKGNEIIRVANILEPGTFPSENLQSYSTPGIALILELPASVRAPAAMHDLIMMARKVSQRLNGRLYNMERHLIKESDLQAMRDAAVEYESEPL